MARKPEESDAQKRLQAGRDQRASANAEAMRQMEESRPTPTQEENDRAKLGEMIDDKESDGSDEEPEPAPAAPAQPATRTVISDTSASYSNRASKSD